jgi:drug/metabolite transporter (DMT)-like permease
VLLHEQLRSMTLVGLVIALVGVAVIMGLGVGQPENLAGAPIANISVLLSSLASAVYTVLGKGLAPRHSLLVFCSVSCLGGAAASLPLAAWELTTNPQWPTPQGWALLAYLGVLVTFFGFALWFWGLRALPAARAGALMFLQPVSGLALARLFLGDQLTPSFLLGCVCVLAGVYLAVRRSI